MAGETGGVSSEARAVDACLACGGALDGVFCDLGCMAVANAYLLPTADLQSEPRHPLRAVVCGHCWLVQLDHLLDPRGIFSDYAYFSSASDSWLAHARKFAAEAALQLHLSSNSLVIEVASNDGYLLRNFVAAGIPCLGVEPAANVAAVASAAGVPTACCFLGAASARDLLARTGRTADLVIANNVLAHVPDCNDFVAGLALLAGPRGLLSIEVPHLLRLVEGVQFDTLYHEHYFYWSLASMEHLLGRHGLRVVEVQSLPTHGGSLRVFASADAARPEHASVAQVRAAEHAAGMLDARFYSGFDQRVQAVLHGFRAWLAGKQAEGAKVVAYGAAAKGNTFLNAAGVTAREITAVADRSPAKQGRLLPGSHVPIVAPEALLSLAPAEVLVLPWNLVDEVAAWLRTAGYRGGIATAVPSMRAH